MTAMERRSMKYMMTSFPPTEKASGDRIRQRKVMMATVQRIKEE
jgi:hypothetical protein